MKVRERLRQFLFERLLPMGNQEWPADDADLYRLGLDSLRIMQLLVFVEEELGVNLPDHEMTPERVGSVNALVAWIESQPH